MTDFPKYNVIIPAPAGHGDISVRLWCEEQWGERWCPLTNRTGSWACFWTGEYNPTTYRFCFADEQQQFIFTLRWG